MSKKNKKRVKKRKEEKKFCGYKIADVKYWVRSVRDDLKKIKDPRKGQGKKYPLDYVLALYLISNLVGNCECTNTEVFLNENIDIVCALIPEAKKLGIPSHDCFCDILAAVSEEDMEELMWNFNEHGYDKEQKLCIKVQKDIWTYHKEGHRRHTRNEEWKAERVETTIVRHEGIDGKCSRGAGAGSQNLPYTGSVFNATTGMFTAITYIPNGKEKGEATALRKLLDRMDLQGTIITSDALHTNKKTMKTIAERGGEFLLRLKDGSHPKQAELIKAEIEERAHEAKINQQRVQAAQKWGGTVPEPDKYDYQEETFIEKDKSRTSKTTLRAVRDKNNVCTPYSPYINMLIEMKSKTVQLSEDEDGNTVEKVISDYTCYFICSCLPEIETIYRFIKEHWDIESAHWVLDNYLDEDRSTGRTGNQVLSRASFKRLAYNLLRLLELCIPEKEKASIKEKFIFLEAHPEYAIMLVIGFKSDYLQIMAKVYEERRKAYSRMYEEVGQTNMDVVSI